MPPRGLMLSSANYNLLTSAESTVSDESPAQVPGMELSERRATESTGPFPPLPHRWPLNPAAHLPEMSLCIYCSLIIIIVSTSDASSRLPLEPLLWAPPRRLHLEPQED